MLKINPIRSTRSPGFPSLGADTKISNTAEETDPKRPHGRVFSGKSKSSTGGKAARPR
jgi:hypothetical protein